MRTMKMKRSFLLFLNVILFSSEVLCDMIILALI
jgi:hypothetical protein